MRTYRIAAMSRGIWWLSAFLLAIPVAMLIAAVIGWHLLLVPLALLTAIYAWVWSRFRPTAFAIHPDAIEITWPLKRRTIPRAGIAARIIRASELKQEVGWGARVGAGGLWDGLGWLWLITPEHPEEFVRELLAEH